MKIVCLPYHKHHIEPCARFAKGLERHGIKATMRFQSNQEECDLAVVWGHRQHKLFKHQLDRGLHYLVMERGYIGDRFKWTSLGFDGLNGRAKFPKIDDGMARWDKHFSQYLKPCRGPTGNNTAVIMGQVPGDSSLANVNFPQWVQEKARELMARGYSVSYRTHPRDKTKCTPKVYGMTVPSLTLEETLDANDLVATWNSNSGVDAALAGVPVSADDEGSMVYDLRFILDWCKKMAYTQWLPEEIESGAAWEALRTVIDG